MPLISFLPSKARKKQYGTAKRFLATLSEDDRTIFIIWKDGKTQKKIAEALGYRTLSAVTKRLQAMREMFKKCMKEQC